MYRTGKAFRPQLECLERRDTPTSLTVTFAENTLVISGGAPGLEVTIEGNKSESTQFMIKVSDPIVPITINGKTSTYSSPTGVQNMTIDLSGSDEVVFDNQICPIDLLGNLSVKTGNGIDEVAASDLTVQKNFLISNGVNGAVLSATNALSDITVGGNLTINDGNGNTTTVLETNGGASSSIAGNFTLTNKEGTDDTLIVNTNFGGNVTINDGLADSSGDAGFTDIVGESVPSIIKGNVSVSYVNGNNSVFYCDLLENTEVNGNVTYNHGTGNFTTCFLGDSTCLPVVIGGNLSLIGTGTNAVEVGGKNASVGLTVSKNFSFTSGNGSNEAILDLLQVDGATTLDLGNGSNSISVEQSLFEGTFNLKTTGGNATFDMETGMSGTDTLPTVFERSVTLNFQNGIYSLGLAYQHTSPNQLIEVDGTFDVRGLGYCHQDASQITFSLGGSLEFVSA